MQQVLRPFLGLVVERWDSWQVELQGRYSVSRLRMVTAHVQQTSFIRTIATLLLTPLPCVVTMLLMDATPLNPPYDGGGVYSQTWWLWFRVGFSSVIITMCVTSQFCQGAPTLPMSRCRLWTISIVMGLANAAMYILNGIVIGFPTPFAMQLLAAPWFLLVISLVWLSWKDALRDNAVAQAQVKRYSIVWGAQFALIFVYPIYYYVFTLLSGTSQALFSLGLPMLKLVFKNWVSYGVYHLEDLAPTTIVFNVDVFHSLFVSATTQRATSSGTIIVIMAVDALQSGVAYYQIYIVLREVERLMRVIEQLEPPVTRSRTDSIAKQRHRGPILIALHIIDTNPRICGHREVALRRHERIRQGRWLARTSAPRRYASVVAGMGSAARRIAPAPPAVAVDGSMRSVANLKLGSTQTASRSASSARRLTELEKAQLKVVVNVLSVLHMTESYLLVEFVEVVMAFISCVYLLAMRMMPNRIYYTQLNTLSDAQFKGTITNAAVYMSLELISFLLLGYAFQRQLYPFSTAHQLDFVLRKHWKMAQAMLLLWILYVSQLSLEHSGSDYTFKFKWLHEDQLV